MYGSSLRMETESPRALRIRPMLAAVIPLPREEVTPPVTKTYFDMGRAPPGVFRMLPKSPQGDKGRPVRVWPNGSAGKANRNARRVAGGRQSIAMLEPGLDVLVELEGFLVVLFRQLEPDEEAGEDDERGRSE